MSEQSIPQGIGKNRWKRGVELFENGAFERISREVFIMENPQSGGEYTVDLEKGTCDCADFRRYEYLPRFACKHQIACQIYAWWLRDAAWRCAMALEEAS